jgi:hypothetical protein
MEAADALAGSARPDEAAATLARLREAALADEAGKALDAELAELRHPALHTTEPLSMLA